MTTSAQTTQAPEVPVVADNEALIAHHCSLEQAEFVRKALLNCPTDKRLWVFVYKTPDEKQGYRVAAQTEFCGMLSKQTIDRLRLLAKITLETYSGSFLNTLDALMMSESSNQMNE